MSDAKRPDGSYRGMVAEIDAEVLSEAATVRTWRNGPRVPWAVVAVAITAIGGVTTAYVARPPALDCASRGDVNALDKRISDVAESQRKLTDTVSRNADQAHNDFTNLQTLILSRTGK